MIEPSGKVYLVGAGPGDPGRITQRGAELLRRADVMLYDSLASPRLPALATTVNEKILVGKGRGRVAVFQESINRMLVERARAGNVVVRRKGGDPFVFGRGGEEAHACAASGIAFEVVPGITSAVAVPAYAAYLSHTGGLHLPSRFSPETKASTRQVGSTIGTPWFDRAPPWCS